MIGVDRPIAERVYRIDLEGPSGAPQPDGDGGYIVTPAALDPPFVYGAIQPATPADLERFTAGTTSVVASILASIPFHPGVKTTTAIRWTDLAGRPHQASVVGVFNEGGRCVQLQLACAETEATA